MIPYFVFDHITIGPVRLYTWGFFVGLAFSAGYLWVLWQGRKQEVPLEKIIGLTLAIFFGAAIGSRLLFLLQEPQKFLADVSLLWRIEQGGLMLWGGILGGILAGWLYVKLARLNFWQTADLVAPAIALGIGIGRLGCFLINDHQGSPTNLPWGILWPDGIVRHPVVLYEILAMFGLFIFIEYFFLSSPQMRGGLRRGVDKNIINTSPDPSSSEEGRHDGRLFLIFLISYALIRFLLDFLRISSGPLADPRWWHLTTSQWISMAVLLGVFFIFNKKYKKEKG